MLNQPAPDFELPDAEGKSVALKDFKGKQALVVYFYPRDFTPGCTAEACSFRDSYEDFQAAGAEVIGISQDSGESHQEFKQKHQLPFILLSDPGSKVAKAYEVSKTMGVLPGRVTFVIDKAGIVRYTFNSQMRAKAHVTKSLDILKSL